jgi:hypothetical protein
MVAPLVVGMVAVSVASAVIQWQNSQEAASASSAERKRMENLLNEVENPNFDASKFTPEMYSDVQKFVPEVAELVEAINPEIVKVTELGRTGKQAQLDALAEMRAIAQNGNDPIAEIQRARGSRRSANAAQSSRAALDELMQRRGSNSNSGYAQAANLQAISDAFNAENLAAEQATLNDSQRRDQNIRGSAELGGDIYQQDVTLEEKNANIINDFNQWATNRKQSYGQYAAGVKNDASLFNLKNQQDTAQNNVNQRNEATKYNQNLQNQISQNKFNNDISKVSGQLSNSQGAVQDINQRAIQNNTAVQGVASAATEGLRYAQSRNDRADDIARQDRYNSVRNQESAKYPKNPYDLEEDRYNRR